MKFRNTVRSIIYGLLAKRSDPGWRAFYQVDCNSINNVLLYHINGKLGDTVYLAILAQQIQKQRDWKLRVFTTTELVPLWKFLCPEIELIAVKASAKNSNKPQRQDRVAKTAQQAEWADLLITLDSGEDFQSLLDFRRMRPRHVLAPGKEGYEFFDLTVPDGAYSSLKRPVLNKVKDVLSVLEISYVAPIQKQLSGGGAALSYKFLWG